MHDRLKIQPTSGYILQKVNENGKAIIVLGVRKDESATRKASIESHQNLENSNLTPHSDLKNALVYRPIVDLSTDDVWEFLAANDPPWGGAHSDLIKLYREAAGANVRLCCRRKKPPVAAPIPAASAAGRARWSIRTEACRALWTRGKPNSHR